MTQAFVFPGQGAQHVGMAAGFATHSAGKAVFDEAGDILGANLVKLMFEGPMEALSQTEHTQPALLTAGIAALRVTLATTGKTVAQMSRYVAGHSLGEYTALVAAGTLSFADGLRLVRLRGQAMQRAVPQGEGAMAAILGLEAAKVAEVAHHAGCFVANDNANGQIVLSGAIATVEKAASLAKELGAKRAVMLPVSAPFHCPLMAPAAVEMAEALAKTTFNSPVVPVVCNVTAHAHTSPDELRDLLVQQITGQVRWRESMQWLAENGVTHLVEFGCGKVLTGLASRCDPRLGATAIASPENIEAWQNAA